MCQARLGRSGPARPGPEFLQLSLPPQEGQDPLERTASGPAPVIAQGSPSSVPGSGSLCLPGLGIFRRMR